MKFSILCEILLNILKKTNIITNNNLVPILNNLLIKIYDNNIKIISSNLLTEIIIKNKIIESDSNILFIISAKKILSICKKIDKKSVIFFEKNNNHIYIKSGNCNFKIINIIKNIKFPLIDTNKINFKICISLNNLKNLIKKTYYSMGLNDTRKYLNAMLFELNLNKFKTISTDGYRLSIYEIETNFILNKKNRYLVSRQSINELIKFLDNNLDEYVNISFCNKNIYINTKNSLFISKLLDEKFPEYENIIFKKLDYSIKIDKNYFNNVILRISSISYEKIFIINLLFYKNKLIITSYNSEQEKAEEFININYEFNEKIEIMLNGNYLIESLSNINNNFILFKFSDKKSSICIEEYDDSNKKHVIMPIYSN